MRFFSNRATSVKEDDTGSTKNILFYKNELKSKPSGDYISEIHKKWFRDWDLLELHHGYIQWLFPIREVGMNYDAQPLSKHEAELFRNSVELQERIVKSYELMLDFYGLVLVDKSSGQIARNPATYQDRYRHLNSSFHNYLRITRICKCLGMVGLEHYKKPFLNHMLLEVLQQRTLRNAGESCIRFWVPTLRKKEETLELDALAAKLGRPVDRNGRDGWGDEEGVNWSTQYYEPTYPNAKSSQVTEKIATHHCDPFSVNRQQTSPILKDAYVTESPKDL